MAQARPGGAMVALALGYVLLASTLLLFGSANAQTETFAEIQRKDTRIVVTLKARSADGARFIGNNRNCEPDVTTSLFYGPAPGYVDTAVDTDTHLRSNIAIIRTPIATRESSADGTTEGNSTGGTTEGNSTGGTTTSSSIGGKSASSDNTVDTTTTVDGAEAGGGGTTATATETDPADQQTLELYDGTVVIGRPGCIESEERAEDAGVQLVQGRTTVSGTRFFLDQGSDVGTMDGPITLARAAEGASPGLDATAQSMTLDTQDKHATLQGDVNVVSEDRTTTAATLELDEDAGVAVLTGSPARSVKGSDVLQGERLLYYLDSNDVVVLGSVYGELEFDLK